jgi:hypothetical protein
MRLKTNPFHQIVCYEVKVAFKSSNSRKAEKLDFVVQNLLYSRIYSAIFWKEPMSDCIPRIVDPTNRVAVWHC